MFVFGFFSDRRKAARRAWLADKWNALGRNHCTSRHTAFGRDFSVNWLNVVFKPVFTVLLAGYWLLWAFLLIAHAVVAGAAGGMGRRY